MHSTTVIEHLDVLEDCFTGLSSCPIDFAAYQFFLERCKEAFCHCVVVAVAFGTHALSDSIAPQTPSKCSACVLAASITVEYEPGFGMTQVHSCVNRVAHQCARHAV